MSVISQKLNASLYLSFVSSNLLLMFGEICISLFTFATLCLGAQFLPRGGLAQRGILIAFLSICIISGATRYFSAI